jgi:hypothetical protein
VRRVHRGGHELGGQAESPRARRQPVVEGRWSFV